MYNLSLVTPIIIYLSFLISAILIHFCSLFLSTSQLFDPHIIVGLNSVLHNLPFRLIRIYLSHIISYSSFHFIPPNVILSSYLLQCHRFSVKHILNIYYTSQSHKLCRHSSILLLSPPLFNLCSNSPKLNSI